MSEMYINPSDVSIDDGAEGYPQLGVSVGGMFITDPFSTEDGCRSEVDNPEVHYGIPDDFARAMGIINKWLRDWAEDAASKEMAQRRFVCAWSDGFYGEACQLVGIEFFCDGNGYSEEDVARIKNLEVCEIVESRHYGPHHIIYRCK